MTPQKAKTSGDMVVTTEMWSPEAILTYLQRQIDDLRSMLEERYATQTKAVDATFLAQQTAMQTALTAAERAVQTALLSAEKAVTKAEVAADKRFESVNEFRQQLSDQTSTFISRVEAETRINSVDVKLDDETKRLNDKIAEISSLIEKLRNQFLTIDVYNTRHEDLIRRLNIIEQWQANITGRATGFAAVGGLFIAIVSGLAIHLLGG